MQPSDFFQIAQIRIPDSPWDRLSYDSQKILSSSKVVFDSHCHIFDKGCVKPGYFLLRNLKNSLKPGKKNDAEVEEAYTSIAEGKDNVESVASTLNIKTNNINLFKSNDEDSEIELGGKWDATKILFKNDMREVLELYLNKYSIVNVEEFPFKDDPFFTVVLMMDIEKGWEVKKNANGKDAKFDEKVGKGPKKSIHDQIIELRNVASTHKVLPFLFVDPRRCDDTSSNLYEIFLEAFDPSDSLAPFFGVKVYPALGYLPTDWRLDPIWKLCSQKGIPVVTHCGGTTVSTFSEDVIVYDCTNTNQSSCKEITVPGSTRVDRAHWLNDPSHWIPVLNKYPTLRLNFGHFGGTRQWVNKPMGERAMNLISIMNNYPNVYSDFSFNLVEKSAVENFVSEVKHNKIVQERALFGTDFWVVLPESDLIEGQRNLIKQLGNNDLIDRLFSKNPANWLGLNPPDSFPVHV